MQNIAKVWQAHNITLIGETLVINTLMCSLFSYHMDILPPLSEHQIIKINSIIVDFLWNGRHSKIPKEILQCNTGEGGSQTGIITFSLDPKN